MRVARLSCARRPGLAARQVLGAAELLLLGVRCSPRLEPTWGSPRAAPDLDCGLALSQPGPKASCQSGKQGRDQPQPCRAGWLRLSQNASCETLMRPATRSRCAPSTRCG